MAAVNIEYGLLAIDIIHCVQLTKEQLLHGVPTFEFTSYGIGP